MYEYRILLCLDMCDYQPGNKENLHNIQQKLSELVVTAAVEVTVWCSVTNEYKHSRNSYLY